MKTLANIIVGVIFGVALLPALILGILWDTCGVIGKMLYDFLTLERGEDKQ